jgi:hypothetical protein
MQSKYRSCVDHENGWMTIEYISMLAYVDRSHYVSIDTGDLGHETALQTSTIELAKSSKLFKPNLIGNSDPRSTGAMVSVVYVLPADAKRVKGMLAKKGLLSKRHRMIKIAPQPMNHSENGNDASTRKGVARVAVPLNIPVETLMDTLRDDLDHGQLMLELLLAHGQREMPLSSAQFASGTP